MTAGVAAETVAPARERCQSHGMSAQLVHNTLFSSERFWIFAL